MKLISTLTHPSFRQDHCVTGYVPRRTFSARLDYVASDKAGHTTSTNEQPVNNQHSIDTQGGEACLDVSSLGRVIVAESKPVKERERGASTPI
jgi:hypothetical protein